MLMGYLLSGIAGGVVAAAGSLALGHPALMALLLYSLFGILAMMGFGLVAEAKSPRG